MKLKRHHLFSLLLLIVFGYIFYLESTKNSVPQVQFNGETMGTNYNIKYLDEDKRHFKSSVDSLLAVFNKSLNHYNPQSEISKFNRQDTFYFDLPYFFPVLEKSKQIYNETNGLFDPTTGPLVNAWGFGPDGPNFPDSLQIDSLKKAVGFNQIEFDSNKVWKTKPNTALDFSAIAKGYGVDVVADFLQKEGIQNLMVEIGGEVVCKGKNKKGKRWSIGIRDPKKPEGSPKAIIRIKDKALASSGNYLQYYEKDGKKYSHTINPDTGYPVNHSLLAVTVKAPDCILADGYATSLMVMGTEKAKSFLKNHNQLEGYLIYSDENGQTKTFMTDKMNL